MLGPVVHDELVNFSWPEEEEKESRQGSKQNNNGLKKRTVSNDLGVISTSPMNKPANKVVNDKNIVF